MNESNNKRMVRECFSNFPESSITMDCIKWDYKKFVFIFVDEDDQRHIVTINKALKGLRLMKEAVKKGQLRGLSLGMNWEYDSADWARIVTGKQI